MKAHLDWHRTAFGRFLLFVGGLRFAIPIMAVFVVGMIWGTWLDSTQGIKVASRLVYGSGWFIILCAMIGVSLIAAVLTRYPWNRRHIGFIIVHAGLIVLMLGGFWSLFGRVEGRLALREGQSSGEIEIDNLRLELVSHGAGGMSVLASVSAEDHVKGKLSLGGVDVEIVDRWPNVREESYVADDGTRPLRAFEITVGPHAHDGIWIAEESKSAGPAFVGGMTIRVLADGEDWSPADTDGAASGYAFEVGGVRYPLAGEGEEAFPGWTITALKRFESAIVGPGGLNENPGGESNPAVDVTISDGAGTVERHTAFEQFPDMLLNRTVQGTGRSGATLHMHGSGGEELILYGDAASPRAAHVDGKGGVQRFEHDGAFPWVIRAGGRVFSILDQATRARPGTRFVEAPPASEYRPAIIVRVNGGDAQPLPWKGTLPVPARDAVLRFGPERVTLPFVVRLNEFRKTDYPGTTMAMSYESDVVVTTPDQQTESLTVFMNNPYAYEDWKVYQSGYVGEDVSIFSVMKDPGLMLTYAGCVILCIGIPITYYVRVLSRGHPGIAPANGAKEFTDAAADIAGVAGAGGDPVGGEGRRFVEGHDPGDPDPGEGPDDAARHLRQASGD